MLQLGLMDDFNSQVLQLYGSEVPMKDRISFIRQRYLTSKYIHNVVM